MLFVQARNLFGRERVIQVGDKVGPTGASVTSKQLAGPDLGREGGGIEGDYHARLGVVRDAALVKSITKLERFHHLLLSLVANRGRRDGFGHMKREVIEAVFVELGNLKDGVFAAESS
ncbi:hypothetical protein EYR36_011934 [Pleurotus pulmonarius]|nr:hypothetical protein EYR36_011934 [Pleurotus pulmonarius]